MRAFCRTAAWLVAALPLLLPAPAARCAEPIGLNADNPHYFQWRGKPTVLITSGEHYGAVLNLDFDYSVYLQTLEKDGLNLTRTFSGVYREIPSSFGITDNPLAPHPNRYIAPWARSGQPGYFDGGNKFDLRRWDPAYFKRLRDFMSQAQQRGIVVELNLFCPMYNDELWKASPMNAANNVNGIGDCDRQEVYTLQHPDLLEIQLAVTRKIVSELQEFDNLYFEVCNEPYFGGVTDAWQRRIVDTIVETERDQPNKHLISLNVANGRKKVEDPPPAVSIFNFHYCVPPDTVGMNYGLNKVIGENETGFRGRDDLLYRTEAWDFILAGGGLFNHLDYSFSTSHPDGSLREYTSPGGGSPELRGQIRTLAEFIGGLPFIRMAPDEKLVQRVAPELSVRALSEPGAVYAVYLHVPLPEKADDLQAVRARQVEAELHLQLPAGRFRAQWLDTRSGKVVRSELLEPGGQDRVVHSPPFHVDIALRLDRQTAERRSSGG